MIDSHQRVEMVKIGKCAALGMAVFGACNVLFLHLKDLLDLFMFMILRFTSLSNMTFSVECVIKVCDSGFWLEDILSNPVFSTINQWLIKFYPKYTKEEIF